MQQTQLISNWIFGPVLVWSIVSQFTALYTGLTTALFLIKDVKG